MVVVMVIVMMVVMVVVIVMVMVMVILSHFHRRFFTGSDAAVALVLSPQDLLGVRNGV